MIWGIWIKTLTIIPWKLNSILKNNLKLEMMVINFSHIYLIKFRMKLKIYKSKILILNQLILLKIINNKIFKTKNKLIEIWSDS